MTDACPWCSKPFEPFKRGGHTKKFCSARCKNAFETAARRYAYAMVKYGLLSVDELRRVSASRATRTARFRPSQVGRSAMSTRLDITRAQAKAIAAAARRRV